MKYTKRDLILQVDLCIAPKLMNTVVSFCIIDQWELAARDLSCEYTLVMK